MSKQYKLLIFLLASFITCCSSEDKNSIIGKWQEIDKEESIEFYADSTFEVSGGGLSFEGRYSFIEEDKLKLEINLLGVFVEPQTWTVNIYSDILIITDDTGESSKFRRISD